MLLSIRNLCNQLKTLDNVGNYESFLCFLHNSSLLTASKSLLWNFGNQQLSSKTKPYDAETCKVLSKQLRKHRTSFVLWKVWNRAIHCCVTFGFFNKTLETITQKVTSTAINRIRYFVMSRRTTSNRQHGHL